MSIATAGEPTVAEYMGCAALNNQSTQVELIASRRVDRAASQSNVVRSLCLYCLLTRCRRQLFGFSNISIQLLMRTFLCTSIATIDDVTFLSDRQKGLLEGVGTADRTMQIEPCRTMQIEPCRTMSNHVEPCRSTRRTTHRTDIEPQ